MITIYIINDCIVNEHVLLDIMTKKGKVKKQILVRSAKEGAYSNTISQHAPTIKIKSENGSKENPVKVPLIQIDELSSGDFYTSLNKFSSSEQKFIKSFIYENQMYILAIWFNLDDRVNALLQELLRNKINLDIRNKLYTKRLNPKTRDELEKDKEDIIKYVRNKLKDDKVIISFNSYTK